MKPEDVREILAGIDSLDRDAWGRAWSAMGERYQQRAHAAEAAGDRETAAEAWLMAYRYQAFGGWPVQNSVEKKRSFEQSVISFRRHATLADPPIEAVSFPISEGPVHAFLALPTGPRPVPVVIAIGGLDSYKEYWGERVKPFLEVGLGVLCMDMPGTGESPIRADAGSEVMYSAAIDYLHTRPEVDHDRIAILGVSFGAHWSTVTAFKECDRLRAAVYWGGPLNRAFQPEWQIKALGTREYLFDLFPARAAIYGLETLEEFLQFGPRLSLEARGLIGKPTPPMLLVNGEHDSQVPIDDLLLLLRNGSPKEAWVNPEGAHIGRSAKWPDSRILTDVVLTWLVRQLK
jgi:pimeloyl-ACP methyl ester carboxylesterase